jgi:plasmid maintenance system killer protein
LIRSFTCPDTESLYEDRPPGNRLEPLKGGRAGTYGIRIDDRGGDREAVEAT